MALAAALARAATRLLRGGLPPSAAYPALSSRSRQFCSLPADNEPSALGERGGGRDGDPPRRQARRELVKEILHSDRYEDGGLLSPDDEKFIVEKILAHHPRSQDKIGCGLEAIMVDKHPEFKRSRCLFVVRTNGELEDFSYRKCLKNFHRKRLEQMLVRPTPK